MQILLKKLKDIVLLITVFSLPLVISTSCYDTTRIKITLFEIATAFIFLFWFSSNLLKEKFEGYNFQEKTLLLSLVLFFFWKILSYLWNPYKLAGQESQILEVLFFILVIAIIGSKGINFKHINYAILLSAIFVLAYGLIQFFHKDPLNWDRRYIELGRVFSTTGNPSHMALFSYLIFFISLATIKIVKNKYIKTLSFLLLILSLFSLYLTKSRIGFVGFLAGLIIFYYLKKHNIYCILFILPLFFLLIFSFSFTKYESLYYRLLIWKSSLKMALSRPILGWGNGSFSYIFSNFLDPRIYFLQKDSQIEVLHPENLFLYYLTQYGAIGLILFIGFLFLLFRLFCRKYSMAKLSPYSIYYFSIIFAMLVHNLFDTNLYFVFPRFFFWLLLAILITDLSEYKENTYQIRFPVLIKILLIILALFLSFYLILFAYRQYRADRYLKDAVYFSQKGNLNLAEKNYLLSLKNNNFNPLALYLLANLYQERWEKQDPKQALIYYAKTEKIAGNYLLTYFFRGIVYLRLGFKEHARYWLNKAFSYNRLLYQQWKNSNFYFK